MKKQPLVLLTGFAPFGGESVNPSWLALCALPAVENARVVRAQLPVSFDGAADTLQRLAAALRPDILLMVGQAAGRDAITVERVGINLMDAAIADNDGYQPADQPIAKNGADAYFSTLPTRKMVQAMNAAGVPTKLSYTAGTYVCNLLLYTALHTLHVPSGFIHVPLIPVQSDTLPTLPLADITRALGAALACCIEETL